MGYRKICSILRSKIYIRAIRSVRNFRLPSRSCVLFVCDAALVGCIYHPTRVKASVILSLL